MRTLALALACGLSVISRGDPPAPRAEPGQQVRLGDLPPHQRLGVRVDSVRRRIGVIPIAVIVPDEASYVAAISAWTPTARFPVLLDDGRWETHEAIARFVRGFGPKSVVRWHAPVPEGGPAPTLPGPVAERRAALEAAVGAAWDAPADRPLDDWWRNINLTPPGIVVMATQDPAWTAGVALAAGRGQVIAWARMDGEPSQWCELARVDALSEAIAAAAARSGYSWDALGDDLDAVTLALNTPVKILLDAKDDRKMLAVTDVVGRHAAGRRERRWAWASQTFGSSARASIDAMSSLFLATPSAWLFDTYPPTAPWTQFDATAAAVPFRTLGLSVVVDDDPDRRLRDWLARISGARTMTADSRPIGIDAGFIAVNTKGEGTFFEFDSGVGRAGDIPLLRRPAAVYFVHSWSFTAPTQRETIAARWLERGAYQYAGSVHEPFLHGFVPTPSVTARLSAGLPWGAAVRYDDGEPWKIATFGDPLWTLLGEGPRLDLPLPLPGAVDLASDLRAMADEGDFASLLRTLGLLGRDAESARFSRALLRDRPEAVTEAAALAGVVSAAFAGDTATTVELLLRSRGRFGEHPMLADAAWHTLSPVLGTLSERELELLTGAVREDQIGRDGTDLAPAVERVKGRDAARDFLRLLLNRAKDDASRQELERALRR